MLDMTKPLCIIQPKTYSVKMCPNLKDFLSQAEDLLAWRSNLQRDKIRPKQNVFDKLTFLFFTFDMNKQHHQKGMRGMEAFITPFSDMIRRSRTGILMKEGTAEVKFPIEIWRLVLYFLFIDPECMSIPIDILYLKNVHNIEETDKELVNTANLVPWKSQEFNFL